MVQIGGIVVDDEETLARVRRYLTGGDGWGYPAYDSYESERAAGPLTDADLLAPALLNAGLQIRAYEALRAIRGRFDELLDVIPCDLDLRSASDEDLLLLGELFAPLDTGIHGVRGTKLSKVLHRKRPRFVFLYDKHVRCVYQHGTGAPIPVVRGRPWKDFAPILGRAIRDDLQRHAPFWQKLVALAPDVPITDLRALDIVAWQTGKAVEAARPSCRHDSVEGLHSAN